MSAMATSVRERPILMSEPMVRATLDGRKTQTRRVVKPQPNGEPRSREEWASGLARAANYGRAITMADVNQKALQLRGKVFPFRNESGSLSSPTCPYGQPGDRLWVRETALYLRPIAGDDSIGDVMYADHDDYNICYPTRPNGKNGRRQTVTSIDLGWRVAPSIFMPRWASRLTLEITEVGVELLQDISDAHMVAEGMTDIDDIPVRDPHDMSPATARQVRAAFHSLWNALNAKRGYGWDVNPWVWVLSFKRVTP